MEPEDPIPKRSYLNNHSGRLSKEERIGNVEESSPYAREIETILLPPPFFDMEPEAKLDKLRHNRDISR